MRCGLGSDKQRKHETANEKLRGPFKRPQPDSTDAEMRLEFAGNHEPSPLASFSKQESSKPNARERTAGHNIGKYTGCSALFI